MPPGLLEEAAGFLALGALLLLPGLVVVRSPWPFVPFLSISFWVVSWGWLAPAGPGRERFLHVALAASGFLAALRLLKPLGSSRPSASVVAVLGAALARLAPFSFWRTAPGLDAGFASASALLLTWHDGVPASFQPLFPFAGFGTGTFGLDALAADISLLSGVAPFRALLLADLASEGLLVLALFALARRYASDASAALASVVGSAICLCAVSGGDGESGVALAMALAIAGAALVLRGAGRSTAVAAGLCWAAALITLGFPRAVTPAIVVVLTSLLPAGRGPRLRRLGLAAGLAVVLAGPALWRSAAPLGLASLRPPPLALLAAAAALGVVAAARRARWPDRRWVRAAAGALVLVATAADWTLRTARVEVTGDHLAVAGWLREHAAPLDVACSDDEATRAWMPALAGRPLDRPRVPDWIRMVPFEGGVGPCRFQVSRYGSPGPFAMSYRAGVLTLSRRSTQDVQEAR